MRVRYERTMEQSYLIVETENYVKSFEEDMLKNQIPGLLKVHRECKDHKVQFSYQVTNKQSLPEYIKRHPLNVTFIVRLLHELITHMKEAKSYLLESDNFLLQHEYIYVGDEGSSFWLCYYIGYHVPIQEQFVQLFEKWMRIIDYKDSKTVKLVYELYQQSKMDTCTYNQLLEILEREQVKEEKRKEEEIPPVRENRSYVEARGREIIAPQEELQEEQEQLYFPVHCYVQLILSMVIFVTLYIVLKGKGILLDTYQRLDFFKLICFILVGGVLEGYVISTIFSKKKKRSRMVIKNTYISYHENQNKFEKYPELEGSMKEEEGSTITNMQQIRNNSSHSSICPQAEAQVEEQIEEIEETQLLCDEETTLLKIQPCLKLISTTDAGKVIRITEKETVLGSSKSQSDYYLPYKTVSRRHVRICFEEGEYVVEDLNSTNGTFVNQKRLRFGERLKLQKEDCLQLAEFSYNVSIV